MISKELTLHKEPEKYKPSWKNENYSDYGYGYQPKTYTKAEIKEAFKKAATLQIKPGNKYKYKNSSNNFFITIIGWDNNPKSEYYNNNPQIIKAKGNHPNAAECRYSVNEFENMEQI